MEWILFHEGQSHLTKEITLLCIDNYQALISNELRSSYCIAPFVFFSVLFRTHPCLLKRGIPNTIRDFIVLSRETARITCLFVCGCNKVVIIKMVAIFMVYGI